MSSFSGMSEDYYLIYAKMIDACNYRFLILLPLKCAQGIYLNFKGKELFPIHIIIIIIVHTQY